MMNRWKNGRTEWNMGEQNSVVLMNFSGIYREEEFWKTDRYPGLSFRMSVGQTAIVMRKQSQRLINEQKIIQLPESILLIPAIITI